MLAFSIADKPQITRIYQEQAQKLFRYGYTVLHDEAEAADMVQQSVLEFMEIYHRLPVMSEDKLRGYLFIVMRNNLYDACAKRKKSVFLEDISAKVQEGESVEDIVLGNISAEIIRNGIGKLPPRYAAYIQLAYLDELDKPLIADILKVKPDSLRMMDVRAKRCLKEICEKELEVITDAR